ncbi:MAG: hypothetical protein JW724_07600 [Candidatus Altiarchaeota archaeon]|nr:hypothetical protein [Candidatus Altiarchaeota archaeon]
MAEEKYVEVCPSCGSSDIKTDFNNPAKVRLGAPLTKVCRSCGYSACIFPEVLESGLEDYRKMLKEKS